MLILAVWGSQAFMEVILGAISCIFKSLMEIVPMVRIHRLTKTTFFFFAFMLFQYGNTNSVIYIRNCSWQLCMFLKYLNGKHIFNNYLMNRIIIDRTSVR